MVIDKETDKNLRNQILNYHISSIMTDRERAKLFGLPEGCRIRENAKIISIEKLKCGRNVYIGEGVILDASGGLTIGDNTQFSAYSLIYTHSSRDQAISGETEVSKEKIKRKPIKIGKNCYFGGPCIVYPGVTIGDRVTVLPMSVVTKDINDDETVSGAPIGKLKELEQRIKQLEEKT